MYAWMAEAHLARKREHVWPDNKPTELAALPPIIHRHNIVQPNNELDKPVQSQDSQMALARGEQIAGVELGGG